jgi:hypothetical protein
MFDSPSDSRSRQSPEEQSVEARNQHSIEPSAGIPTFDALLGVGNNIAPRLGSDSSSAIDDLARIRMEGWGSIN